MDRSYQGIGFNNRHIDLLAKRRVHLHNFPPTGTSNSKPLSSASSRPKVGGRVIHVRWMTTPVSNRKKDLTSRHRFQCKYVPVRSLRHFLPMRTSIRLGCKFVTTKPGCLQISPLRVQKLSTTREPANMHCCWSSAKTRNMKSRCAKRLDAGLTQ